MKFFKKNINTKSIGQRLIVLLVLLFNIGVVTAQVSPEERQALIDLYNSTDGDNWTNTVSGNKPWLINDPTSLVSDWFGVVVENGSLTKLFLPNNNLTGNLPPSIGDLINLRDFSMSRNVLTGSIPSSIGNLGNLDSLLLAFNMLTGSIPSSISNLINLRSFNLSNNGLTGIIPDTIGNVTSLSSLILNGNELNGDIPASIGNLNNLSSLNLSFNSLTGSIPSSIANLGELRGLIVNDNNLSGVIPFGNGDLPYLGNFSISNNNFEGSIPFVNPISPTDFYGLTFAIDGNAFVFKDFEVNFPFYVENFMMLQYSPQTKVDESQTVSVVVNGSITLSSAALASPNNSYQWYKNNIIIPGATSKDLVINDATDADEGAYHFIATNSIVTDLILTRNPITLTVIPAVNTCGVSEAEKQALVDLYNSTNGPNWTSNNNWLSDTPVCDWTGVTVEDNKVTGLYLFGGGVSGPLPNSIGDLIYLKSLTITRSVGLTGGIPSTIGNLTQLESIDLSSNLLTEPLPAELGNLLNLRGVNLYRNRITGSIPASLGNLTNLVSLSLGENALTGSIPPELGNLVNLTGLNLFQNQLTGSIPSSIGNLTNLVTLALSRNGLTGAIPISIVNLTKINTLDISSNNLSDPIPPELGNMINLTGLNLYRNKITGSIPVELANLTNLVSLSLGENQLTGSIPPELGNLVNLTGLNLFQNQLIGTIPNELGDLVNLTGLNLGRNGLSGSIPSELGNLINLEGLGLNSNNLTGSIPSSIGNMSSLININLFRNNLSGPIPNELANLANLTFLSIESNQISGQIPVGLGNLTNLKTLYLSSNQIEGPIPDTLADLPNLEIFGIQANQINGKIPSGFATSASNGVFKNFQLSRNELVFVDFESDYNVYKNNLTTFSYLEQSKVDEIETISATIGESITLSTNNLTSSNNTYQWFKNNVAIPGATTKDLVINNVSDNDAGVYHFTASNSIITDLTLVRNPITIEVGCGVSESEKQALIDLYNSTNGVNWRNNTNWLTDEPVCDWFGVTVSNGKVTKLTLALNDVAGPLPNNFSDLIHLESVTFERNSLTGTIPSSIGDMSNLTFLHLGSNQLTGEIPASLGNLTNLVTLSLYRNGLTGSIPSEFGNLENLEAMHLHESQLSGTIPASIGNLTKLKQLRLYINTLEGPLPSELGNLSSLEVLHLERNRITGEIPTSFGNLSSLQEFNLGNNRLSGNIPTELGNLTNLINLRLFWNSLEGEIPSELSNIPGLETISLTRNALTGEIPLSLATISTLKFLDITTNNITGSIPASFGQLPNLNHLGIAQNNLSGKIPSEFGTLTDSDILNVLGLQQNNFVFSDFETDFQTYQSNLTTFNYLLQAKVDQEETRSVPLNGTITLTSTALTSTNNSYQWFKDGTAITGATSKDFVITNATDTDAGIYHFTATNNIVTDLILERNPITLTISEDTCGVSESEKQALIDFFNATGGNDWVRKENWLTDTPVCDWYGVTVENGTVTELRFLFENNLVGEIPGEKIVLLSNLISLQFRSQSQLTGNIPKELGQLNELKVLSLRQNSLSGEIPIELANLSNLENLSLDTNALTGTIPTQLGSLSNLKQLDLFRNQITGTIPLELGQLSNLGFLRLFGNQLTGTIPPELGQLSQLVQLNLSSNQLTGFIPNELGQLGQLDALGLGNNELTGSIPSELSNIDVLRAITVERNNLSGVIPSDIAQLSNFDFFYFIDNNFVFSDFENEHVSYQSNVSNYQYNRQSKVDQEETIEVQIGGSVTLSTTQLTSPNNTYTWYKGEDVLVETTLPQITIDNITSADLGEYYFTATNSVVEGLTLTRNKITLALGVTDPDGCDVLEDVVDGSFESCSTSAGIIGTTIQNNDLSCSDFDTPGNLIYTWKIDPNNEDNLGEITSLIQPSPEGGVFASCRVYQPQSSFPSIIINALEKELEVLEIGAEYEISFYQSNGGFYGATTEFEASWRVSWADGLGNSQVSPAMLVKGGIAGNTSERPNWDLVKIRFTAPDTFLKLNFVPVVPSHNSVDNGVLVHLLLDGITVNKIDGCDDSITEQRFCGEYETLPTIGDLVTPILGTTITWFDGENSDAALLPPTVLTDNTVYWARSNNDPLLPRVGVRVILENEFPTAPSTQVFNADDNPTVNDLQATGSNIQWYLSELEGSPLSSATPLTNNTSYYASENNGLCRLQVVVTVNTSGNEDCDILEGIADGSFENCLAVANPISEENFNRTIDCSNWDLTGNFPLNPLIQSSVSTWVVDGNSSNTTESQFSQHISTSPDGGVFTSSFLEIQRRLVNGEGIKTTVNGLSIGVEYIVSFYQSNGGSFDDPNGIAVFSDPKWQVSFGNEVKFGSSLNIRPISDITESIPWEKVELRFTATTSEQVISFTPSVSYPDEAIFVEGASFHLLIDGIKVSRVDGDCNNNITEQRFCEESEIPVTVGDLISPISGTTVTWFDGENSDAAFLPEEPLVNDYIYWASSNNDPLLARVGVKVILDSGTPTGLDNQAFNAVDNPTVADLQVVGSNIQWYLSEEGQTPLTNSTTLINNTFYYAAEGSNSCRLQVLVTINTSGDGDCDLLEGVVDGSFQDCALVAGSTLQSGFNNNISCSNWEPVGIDPNTIPSTWIVDLSDSGSSLDPVMTSEVRQSPDGGIFASALVTHGRGASNVIKSQGFKTTLSNLEIGATYTVSFYQSQGGGFDTFGNTTVPNIENVLAQWQVFFGNEVKNSSLIPIQSISEISIAPVWEKQEITFVPTETEQELNFVSFGSLINVVENVFYYNLLIDGIKLTKNGEDCNDDITEQRFCILNGDITIGDLQSPFADDTASWHLTALDKALILPEYVIPESGIYWAESNDNSSLPRIPVNVILDDQIPTGDTVQIFDEVDSPTVADLQVMGDNIQWYLSENGEIPLTNTTSLIPNTYYYAATGESSCRLKVLVRFNTIDNCNILSTFADGSFEECFADASTSGHNHDITCGNWVNGKGTADSWKSPYTSTHDGVSSNMKASPNGGVFAGAIARAIGMNELESFYTEIQNLTIGETYSIEFYQSNATGRFDVSELKEEARWKVLFGDQIQYSSYMEVTENPIWQKHTLDFVANSEEIRLEFVASSANRTSSTSYVYMLIDGIKFSQTSGDGSECPDDVVYETQSFCTMINYPRVSDLIAPEGATDVVWYSSEIGGIEFDQDDFLALGNPFLPVVDVYWAESSQYIGRKPVRVILDEGIPVGSGIQVFSIGDNATIADLEVTGNNVLWYDSPTSQEPLPISTPLQHLGVYYAEHNGLDCRLVVDVRIETISPEVEGVQIFCASDYPTVEDLVVTPTDPTYSTSWYASPEGGTPLANNVILIDGNIYYASQNDGNAESAQRAPVFVIVRDVAAPTGPTVQTVYTNDTGTVSDLIAYGFGIVWYDGNGVILSPDEPLEEGGIYYASQTDFSGNCLSIDRLSVRVSISPELPPEYFSCEKFRPQPGDRYVVSGWAKESGVTITATDTKGFSEINDKFIDLLNHLRDLIITQTPVPKVYIPSPEDRIYDELVPYIETTGIDNLTIYNLQPVKENQGGFYRTVGFSFSFDEAGNTGFTYMNPVNVYEWGISFYRYPMVNVNQVSESGEITGPMEITFNRLTSCSTGVCLETNFKYRFNANGVTPVNINSNNNYRVSNILKETVDFNTYVPNPDYQAMDYANSLLKITYTDREGVELPEGASVTFRPKGNIIDGWQRISADFRIPNNAEFMTVSLQSEDTNLNVYFDDIRFHPFDSNMKTFVYDPETQRLQSELDENNYSTFYEYDIEGGLIRVKKETERGVYTIQETRSGNSKLNSNE
ncbi:Leucine-rich repeat (LRR) protein [Aquimarina amphilecti]|uniref:Leucine-rich repeat (LRR) protein n=1 Tax=Aquimarina amphilecti TaxID=1038014 RepID=A0A1H7FWX1_AQUAM|nr:hypothetical protein [Aquimarina amphilecti]SEK30428.1 Leucine-rich repeat (LRR) protein [Aquimarina amphilecti]